jgi:hypothetical protein
LMTLTPSLRQSRFAVSVMFRSYAIGNRLSLRAP